MKHLVAILFMLLPFSVMGQQFGYMDYDALLKATPAYAEMQQQLDSLKAQYQAEMDHSEAEFNRKYNEFLEGQKTFAQNILLKRQKELQGLYENGLAFRAECEAQLKKAEEALLVPVKNQLNQAIRLVGQEMNLEYIISTSQNALLFAGPNAFDVTLPVKEKLGLQ